MLTEEDRAELLASNASRDVVEKTIALVDKLLDMLSTAMAPRATGYEFDEACPMCAGDRRFSINHDNGSAYEHADGCQFVALGLKLYEWEPPAPVVPDQTPPTRRQHTMSELREVINGLGRDMVRAHLNAQAPLMGDMVRRGGRSRVFASSGFGDVAAPDDPPEGPADDEG